MAEKKKKGTKNTSSAKKEKQPEVITTNIKKKNKKTYTNQFWSVVLFAAGILVFLLIIIEGNSGWYWIHNVIRGLFGFSVIFVPIILIYTSLLIARDESQEIVAGRVLWGIGLMMLTSAIVQIFIVGEIPGSDFGLKIKNLYDNGRNLKGGGVISGLVAWPLLKLFGAIGAKIIILLLFFVFMMLLTNFGLFDFFGLFYKPVKTAHGYMKRIREENALIDEYDEEIEKEKELEKKKDKEALGIFNSKKNKPVLPNKDFDLDIPITVGGNKVKDTGLDIPILDKEVNADKSKKQKQKSDGEPEIEELINRAMEDSIKKKKTEAYTQDESVAKAQVESPYKFPPISLLKQGTNTEVDVNSTIEMKQKADILVDTLKSFGVQTRIVGIHRGPTVTRYEVQPSAGVKISRITGLADDIALNLAAAGVRIEAPIPGKSAVGIEVPNEKKDLVTLREILESKEFKTSKSKLTFCLGKDIAGNVVLGDVAKMPHVIIAGATGSGKSVCTNSIIMSILYNASPDEVRLVLIDPKIVEFKVYDGIPHLLIPVVTDPRKAAGALNWAVQEMLKRYQLFADNNVRDITGYNELAAEREDITPIPKIVIAIDELADLMMAASKEVEDAICRLAQMARAAGMHLIIATQRPTVNVITGLIKANIPSRIALSVMSQTDSRTILDMGGAEKLLGHGDMLYFPSGMPKPVRVQGCFCSTKEIESVVEFIKKESQPDYSDEILDEIEKNTPVIPDEKESPEISGTDGDDEIIEKAIEIIVEAGQASTSMLQRRLKLGYARAARIMDEIEGMGIVGESEGAKPRKVLLSKQQWAERKMRGNI